MSRLVTLYSLQWGDLSLEDVCIKAKEFGYHAQIINSGRAVNDGMGSHIAKTTVKRIISSGKNIAEAKVLVMGATFKENVSDIRNSKVVDVVKELQSYNVKVDIVDPLASSKHMKKEYDIELKDNIDNGYDAIVLAVNHEEYSHLEENYFQKIGTEKVLLFDVKGIYKDKFKNINYISL